MKSVAVIPAYNEERTIATVVLLAKPHVDSVVVVDDGSSDRTARLAKDAGADVVRLPENQGKGAAMAVGFATALAAGADAIVTLDADFQHDPSGIPAVLAAILAGQADVAIGARRSDAGSRSQIPRARRAGQAFMAWAGAGGVADTESGFRAYSGAILTRVNIREQGYGADWEILQRAVAKGARVIEIPIAVRYLPSPPGRSPARHGLSLIATVIRYARSERPLLFFGVPGLSCLLVALVLLARSARAFLLGQVDATLLAGLSLGALGVILVVSGLVLDAIALRDADAPRPGSR